MCVYYRGNEYHYGLVVTVQTDSQPRDFHVLMTKHMEDRPYVYTGLCLENGLMVTTNKRKRYVALCQIIQKIIDVTLLAEKAFTEQYPGYPYKPFKDVEEGWILKYKRQFAKRMKKALSLDKYVDIQEKIKPLWEKEIIDPEENNEILFKNVISLSKKKCIAFWTFIKILRHSVPIIYDCKEMKLAWKMVQKNPDLCVSSIKYRRI